MTYCNVPCLRGKASMSHQNSNPSFSLKAFLFLVAAVFAAAATILIISASSAATVTGSAPALAVSLVEGANTGLIAPGGQRWFRFVPDRHGQVSNLEKSLTLFFTPSDDQHIRRVQIQIFDESQLPFFYFGDVSRMANLGAGQIVSRDNNPETGELLWTGWLSGQQNYYVQLANGNDVAIDYWLFTDNVTNISLGEPSAPVATAVPSQVPVPPVSSGIDQPAPLTPEVTGARLEANSTHWYTFTPVDPSSQDVFIEQSFSLFFTPDDGNRSHRVNFKLFPAQTVEMWQRGGMDQLVNFGAGELVSRDGDPNTGERIWRGVVLRGETYLLAIENGSEVGIDYRLFEGDVIHP
jgi:hypothetical protein